MTARERLRTAGRLGEDIALGPLTTYRFGGPARYLVRIDGEQDLRDAYEIAAREGLPLLPLGRGSNVVVADSGFAGVVLQSGPGLSTRMIVSCTSMMSTELSQFRSPNPVAHAEPDSSIARSTRVVPKTMLFMGMSSCFLTWVSAYGSETSGKRYSFSLAMSNCVSVPSCRPRFEP